MVKCELFLESAEKIIGKLKFYGREVYLKWKFWSKIKLLQWMEEGRHLMWVLSLEVKVNAIDG